MFTYSKNSTGKVYHLSHCSILRRIKKENRQVFQNKEEAEAAGYRCCSCCSPVAVRYRRDHTEINAFCKEHNISCRMDAGQLLVTAPASTWRVIVAGASNTLLLYHKNTYDKDTTIPSCVPGYHSQAIRSKTILGYLEYIVRHDVYREGERKKDQERRDQESERRAQKAAMLEMEWQRKKHRVTAMKQLRQDTKVFYGRDKKKPFKKKQAGGHRTHSCHYNASQLYSVMQGTHV